MILNSFFKVFEELSKPLIKHSPEILTALGVTGMCSATIMAVKATPKVLDVVSETKDKKLEKKEETKEIIVKAGKYYIPTILVSGLSIACILGASSINLKRNAALATAYSISENALKEYQSKVLETIGPRKERQIKDEIVKDHIAKNPVTNTEVYITGDGDTLFYDDHSGRYFMQNLARMEKIENMLNKRLWSEMWISLNDLYYEIGLNTLKDGDDIGFNIDDGYLNYTERYSAQVADDGRPCLAIQIEERIRPRMRYGDML